MEKEDPMQIGEFEIKPEDSLSQPLYRALNQLHEHDVIPVGDLTYAVAPQHVQQTTIEVAVLTCETDKKAKIGLSLKLGEQKFLIPMPRGDAAKLASMVLSAVNLVAHLADVPEQYALTLVHHIHGSDNVHPALDQALKKTHPKDGH